MIPKMPRGAIPSPRSEIAATEPYRPGTNTDAFIPSGTFPTPNYELAAAQPYKAVATAPESCLAWPIAIGPWSSANMGDSSWAEEAFAKSCAKPKVLIPADVVETTARECGSSNFSAFMQTHGFKIDGKLYLNGPFRSVSWTNVAALNGAIAHVGPVKIGVASATLDYSLQSRLTPRASGWAIHGLRPNQSEDLIASLCGYGPLTALVERFERHGVNVKLPTDMPDGLCYAMFTRNSIGIIDRQSLLNITGEAWVRDPTTIVKNLGV